MKKEFYTGHLFDVYEYLGAHKENGGFVFRVFAPGAKGVTVMGEFSGWQEFPMYQDAGSGVYISQTVQAREGQMYKYCIYTGDGRRVEHCDPYGFCMELRPGDCSILTDLNSYKFHDEAWMRERTVCYDAPVNIYELHAGSWKKKGEEETDWYNYAELAELLIPYIKENHYTHIELMPLSEHPFDGSWGYQNTGFFAPTSRYGTPDQLKELVDKCHQAGIGVIMDFVPVHFAVDAYGLKEFDGTCLYEYPHAAVGESEWGSCNFMHSRGEVRCFIQSAANYWLSEFHFDGLRMDAVSRLIYWQGDEARGVNGTTIEFLKGMNQGLKRLHPTAMLIAEDSTSFPDVTKPVEQGGLGFDYKWDLGFMHDTLEYFQTGPEYRSRDYHKLTFSMMYYYNEKYMLEYCHDEVVHGKATILQKMNGDYEQKFPQGRAMYLYMMMHPGKKLNFMGNEFGQLREWDEKREQDWDMLKYPNHDAFHHYMTELNRIYQENDAFHHDYDPNAFRWADCHQEERCIYAIERKGREKNFIAVFNFSDKVQKKYGLPVERDAKMKIELNTDWEMYGGTTKKTNHLKKTEVKDGELVLNLPSFSGILISLSWQEEPVKKAVSKKEPAKRASAKKVAPKSASAKKA